MPKFNFFESGRNLGFWCLGIALGLFVGGIPIVLETSTDAFDKVSSYLIWLVGMSLSSMSISFFQSERVWRWCLAVGFGFPVFIILDFIYGSRNYQLFPLTVMLALIVGIVSAFPGAYLGKVVKLHYRRLKKGQIEHPVV
jgi:hypothetical protein